ncbi:MAG: hypothetical protein HOV81_19260 [Kofleriaceae bacterium]|nr:hypothetical protein [Kofleriaceae bacterium]
MTGPLLVSFGLSLGAAVLNAVLGLTRPLSRTYLSFAWIMAFVAAHLYLEWILYKRTITPAEAVEVVRLQLLAAHALIAGVLIFIPTYTQIQLPRWIWRVMWVLLGIFFLVNVLTPYGVWFSAKPRLIATTVLGELAHTTVPPPLGPLQYAHAVYVVAIGVIAVVCAIKMFGRGNRQRAIAIALSLGIVVVLHLVDVVREAVGGSWLYIGGFGLVAWGIVMTVQLAMSYREVEDGLLAALARLEAQKAEMTDAIAVSVRVRDRLNTPLQTLELGLSMQPDQDAIVEELRHEIHHLTTLGRCIESTAAVPRNARGNGPTR